jgi:predicted DCC family thiol-disulfide oxidoreductase YuxK
MAVAPHSDSGNPAAGDGPVLLFDGVCNLCNAGVAFIVRRDPRGRFRFAPLQSEVARRLLQAAGVDADDVPDSMIVVEEGRVYDRSAAALRIARALRWPWPALSALWLVPRPVRDWLYRLIARNRYRWFGRRDQCMTPTPELEARFL